MSGGVDILLYTTGEEFDFCGVHHQRGFCARWCRLTPLERNLIFVVYTTGEDFAPGGVDFLLYTTGADFVSSGVYFLLYTMEGYFEFRGVHH